MRKLKFGMLTGALLTSVLAFGETFTDDNGLVWTYTASSGKATLSAVERTDGQALTGTLVIPSTVTNDLTSASATVVEIKKDSFKNLSITSLTVANSVTTIGAGAFANCSAMLSVDLGNGLVTIGHGESNVNGHHANTSNPDSYASSGAFGNCSSLETVTFGENIVTIGAHAFSECIAIEALTLPDSVQTIGENAFCHNTSLASVSLGTGLTTISEDAFYNCPELQSVVFRESDTPLLAIGKNAFAKAVKLTTLTFSESLKSIGNNAFAQCTSLESLAMPGSLTTLGAAAFNGCSSLVSVNLGNGLVTIGHGESNVNGHHANTSNPDSYASSISRQA